MYDLKDCQNTAVDDLRIAATRFLKEDRDRLIVFKAPTGAGKTIMTGDFLDALATSDDLYNPLSFIWLAPRMLHKQSYEKIAGRHGRRQSSPLTCCFYDSANPLVDRQIGINHVWFFNWESIREEGNVFVAKNEDNLYLDKIVETTRDEGRQIVLVIDESHYHAGSEVSQDLVDRISPKLIVEVTATPPQDRRNRRPYDVMVEVPADKAKEDGLIKHLAVINDGVGNSALSEKGEISFKDASDVVMLDRALSRRNDLAAQYAQSGSEVKPLLCIQLPDRKKGVEDECIMFVERELGRRGITAKNRRLAVWLSERNENTENISDNDSEVEVLIFKQSIAQGWDCPRAQVLLLFRKWSDNTFSAQTLGRIMRMPERKHYDCPDLNKGYVYTNMQRLTIAEDVAKEDIHTHRAQRIEEYNAINLTSMSRISRSSEPRLTPDFIPAFLEIAKKETLEDKIFQDAESVREDMIGGAEITDIDSDREVEPNVTVNLESYHDLQSRFDNFAVESLNLLPLERELIGIIKEAIYAFFNESDKLKMDYNESTEKNSEIIRIVLDYRNRAFFDEIIKKASEVQGQEHQKPEFKVTRPWEVPEASTYGNNHKELSDCQKSAVMPFFARSGMSTPEANFIRHMESDDNIQWWHKNGDSGEKSFAVLYERDGRYHLFYVDFIVYYKDGTIGLYDTKSGYTLKNEGGRSAGLQDYLSKENERREKKGLSRLVGGIVTEPPAGGWKVYSGKGENIDDYAAQEWTWFGDMIK